MTAEHRRLEEAKRQEAVWKKWGPYLSERQWGTVREDYGETGDAWEHFTHDQARSRAYRWGEDGLAGFSDEKQRLCFSLALWNGADPILKERLFGLTNSEGNHGEDVKEYYFYLDSTPTHSYLKYLYKYPHAAYPYDDLVATNRRRTRLEPEYELVDTGIFDEDRYFDVFVEYAKASPDDILIRITACNRGPDEATLHLLPTLWFRNTWAHAAAGEKPVLQREPGAIRVSHPSLGDYRLCCEGEVSFLFTENETNRQRLWGERNASTFVKDGINDRVVHGRKDAVNPAGSGTKAAAHYRLVVPGGGEAAIRLRLRAVSAAVEENPFGADFEACFAQRRAEADAFYATLAPPSVGEDGRNVMRQALAGMLWTKQYYCFDVERWLKERDAKGLSGRGALRNREWFHMACDNVISMPDKWEYPWFASWDLAFHAITLGLTDLDFAKEQLDLMLRDLYLHPNGQIPAYEWNFGDVNPPVHAWATFFLYSLEKELRGRGDTVFLKGSFNKLLLNFTWWVNRKDPAGKNVFEGGFLGLDNIGVFDRSSALPTGGYLEQADGTAWMALYCQNMLEIALELAVDDPVYEDFVLKFLEHFLWIASAMDRLGEHQDEMWDEEDGFFYDVLRFPGGSAQRLKVHSLVGLLPLCAVTVIEREVLERFPRLRERFRRFLSHHPEVTATVAPLKPGVGGRGLLAILDETKLRRVLARMLDESEFLGPHGIRSVSRFHERHPFEMTVHGEIYRVKYLPAESDSGMFGGNSNWRGPVWMPMNVLLIRALFRLHQYYGDDFTVEFPTGSGQRMNLLQITRELAFRLIGIFRRDANGRRPVYGGTAKFQQDPHFRDLILFYEYYHGDNGAGLGASHQTGWSGAVAWLIYLVGRESGGTRADCRET